MVGTFGGFVGDQFFFMLGRARGVSFGLPAIQAQSARVQRLVDRYLTWLIVGVRFMYGLRVAGPVLLGMSEVSYGASRFNALGALLWAALIGGAGYAFGEAFRWCWRMRSATKRSCSGSSADGFGIWAYRRTRRVLRSTRHEA